MDLSRFWDGAALWVALYGWKLNSELLHGIEDTCSTYAKALRGELS